MVKKVRRRLEPKIRKQQILEAAIELAREKGIHSLRRDTVALYAGVGIGLISYYFNPFTKLKAAVTKHLRD